jgi:hypothetical protein
MLNTLWALLSVKDTQCSQHRDDDAMFTFPYRPFSSLVYHASTLCLIVSIKLDFSKAFMMSMTLGSKLIQLRGDCGYKELIFVSLIEILGF